MSIANRDEAAALDAIDPLASFRSRFVIDDDVIYLAGNSLGRLPTDTASALATAVADQWGRGLVGSWESWIDLPTRVGDQVARLVGAEPGECIVADSTTVNLYKLASAALDARPGAKAIVADADDFPTDRFVLEGLAAARGVELRTFSSDPLAGSPVEAVTAALDGGAALVVLSHVDYRSATVAPMAEITARAHDAGALALWDLSHSVGVVPVELEAVGVDLAVGCTYKYLNAGPGSPAFLYVRRQWHDELRQPVWGWFGQRDQFGEAGMAGPYVPEPGITANQTGTPPVLGLIAVEAGVALVAEAGLEAVRTKSTALTSLAVDLFDALLAPLGFTLGSRRDPTRRGGHVTIVGPRAWALTGALIDAGVVPDFRAPDAIRLGFSPLYTRFVDVWDAFGRMHELAQRPDLPEPPPKRVT